MNQVTRSEGEDGEITQITLKIWHPDCWTLESTAAVDAGLIAHSVYKYSDLVNARVTAFADSREQIDALVAEIRESGLTDRVERVHNYFNSNIRAESAGNATDELLVKYEPETSIHPPLLSRGFIPEEEIRVYDGYEYWTVIVTASRETIQGRLDNIRQKVDADITVQGVKSPDTRPKESGTKAQLSERQRQIFELGRRNGYYNWPREISATELADKADIAKPTVLEHLRKAESKLLDPKY